MNDIGVLMKAYKDGDNNALVEIIMAFEPLIQKYVKKLHWCEREDVEQELKLAIIESARKMDCYDNSGKCVNYIARAIKNRFCYLFNKSVKRFGENLYPGDEAIFTEREKSDNSFLNIEFFVSLEKELAEKPEMYRRVAYFIVVKGYSDAQIAARVDVSRQYINRVKKKILCKRQFDQ